MSEKATVQVDIREMWALIDDAYKIYNAIPKDSYYKANKAGTTMGEVAAKYLARARELENILEETWPK